MPAGEDGERPSDALPPLTIESVRPFRKGFLLKFSGVETRTQAEGLRGSYVVRPFDEIDDLAEGEIFYHELLGASVVTTEGEPLGTVKEVYAIRPVDMLEVEGPDGDIMIPLVPHIVIEFDRGEGRVVVDPPPGLLG